MPQLMRITLSSGALRYFRCPYQANVMKTFETSSSRIVSMFFTVVLVSRRLRGRCRFSRRTLPVKVSGDADEHDEDADDRFLLVRVSHDPRPDAADHEIEAGQPGVSRAAIRPFYVGARAPQHEERSDGGDVS